MKRSREKEQWVQIRDAKQISLELERLSKSKEKETRKPTDQRDIEVSDHQQHSR